MIKYEKVLLLDLDLLILHNIDNLFNWPHLSGVACGHIVRKDWVGLNSGLLVIEPNLNYFNELVNIIDILLLTRKNESLGDQDVFQYSIPGWENRDELHIPEEYNEYYRWAGRLAKTLNKGWKGLHVIHYFGKKKPWNYSKREIISFYFNAIKSGRFDLVKTMHMYRKRL